MTPSGYDVPLVSRIARFQLGKLGAVGEVPSVMRELVETGLVHPIRPDKLALIAREFVRWGVSPATSAAAAAIERPDEIALVDEIGELSFRDLHERSNGLARVLRDDGVEAGDGIAPDADARFAILTSGTTGTPKGAQRSSPNSLAPVTAMLSKLALRARETTMIAAPLFHSWGFAHLQMAQALGSRAVLRRRFDPEGTLEAVESSGATVLAVVPVMLQRILDLPEETLKKYDLSTLRVTAVSGSALPGELATRWMDLFGDNVYNLYGSTEVAYATIAAPEDLREAPGTAGRAPRGSVVKIYDEDANELSPGETGRIFVGNEFQFEGYTGGETKEEIDGLMASGDVGHFDDEGRLFIDGRDDEMIVSGGENVFPREVEDLLSDHEAISEAAVIGVDDEEFGQRLKAFVVTVEDTEISEDEIRKHVKSHLANYKVPREVEFLDSLPRNSTGKVLKKELA